MTGPGIGPHHDPTDVKPVRDAGKGETQPYTLVQWEQLGCLDEDSTSADVPGVGRPELLRRPVANLDFNFGPHFFALFRHLSGLPQNPVGLTEMGP